MTIKIAYDYQAFALTSYGGGSRYLYEVSKRISQIEKCEVKIIAPLYKNKYIANSPVGMVIGKKYDGLQDLLGITSWFNRSQSKYWLRKNPPDILHETYYSTYDVSPSYCKVILTVHDMIHEKFIHRMSISEINIINRKKEAIRRADRIICVSENTKQDLLEIFDLDPSKIFVVYHGCSLITDNEKSEMSFIDGHYLLYIGARGYYKNFKKLLQAYVSSSKIYNEFKLVCFGGGDFSQLEKLEIAKLKLKMDKIIHLEGGDQLLSDLYTNATAFIYPSLYEGFGIPPIEAMYLGCPVICSNAGSIPEVVGEAGCYFDPHSIENMVSAIESVVFSEESRKNLIEKGRQRATLFSWQKCAQETYNVYRDLISHGHK